MTKMHLGSSLLFVVACVLFSTTEAHAAQTYAYTSCTFDHSTGKIVGYAYTEADYNTQAFYVSVVDGKLEGTNGQVKDETQVMVTGHAETRITLPAWADTEYTMSALHSNFVMYFQTQYFYNGNYYTGYDDYYGYTETPEAFITGGYWFTAVGVRYFVGASFITLGTSSSKKRTGVPVKALVLSDQTAPDPDCPSTTVIRSIEYRPLDSNNKAVGRYHAYEYYFNPVTGQNWQTVQNSCTGESSIPAPNDCDLNALPFTGSFIDELRTYCPTGTTPCGLPDILVRWYWCNRSGGSGTIFKATYRIKNNQVLVNNTANLTNAVMYP